MSSLLSMLASSSISSLSWVCAAVFLSHPFVFANQPPRRAQPNHGWNVETAPEYGGVAGGTAHVGYEAFDALVFEVDGVGGGEVVGDEDDVVQQRAFQIEFGALPDEVFLDALHDLQHVLFALAQVFVVDFVELLGEAFGLDFERPFSVDLLFFNNINGFARQGGIGEQHQVQRDECAQLGGGVFGDVAADVFQLLAGGFDSGFKAGGFGGDVALGKADLRDFGSVAADKVGAPDGDAAACGVAVDDEHGYSPSPK